ncbi:MAG: putative FAD-dependent dehydrogenase [Patiriisocius sp.]|jgi:uncharacterized FAD-dependent dehydrogenase
MLRQVSIRLSPEKAFDDASIEQALKDTGKCNPDKHEYVLRKRSIDARHRIVYVMHFDVAEKGELISQLKERKYEISSDRKVAVIGAGSAGLFAALKLLEQGIKPMVFERGKDIRGRRRDIAKLTREHIVNPESNYCYGEGGAGTFSDGKLYTRSSKRGSVKDILEILVNHGADNSILIDAHPHIGTNKLPKIITAIRETIENAGGEIIFNSKLTDIKISKNCIDSIEINEKEWLKFDSVILATGHSARDVYEVLNQNGVKIESKGFAMGVRVEHSQSFIDQMQYKMEDRGDILPAAAYSLVSQIDGRGVYSFCMCPGGVIAPCATSEEEIVTNGWSPSKRNNPHANSGIVVTIEDEDCQEFKEHGPLAGMHFQKSLEYKAWVSAGKTQAAPAQRLVDFMGDRKSRTLPDSSYIPGLTSVEMKEIFPKRIENALRKGFKAFDKKMKGFIHPDAVIVAIESRSSSPVRIPRDSDTLEHVDVKGLYPCAEGAGYAGGIVSAAIDGERCAMKISESVNI